MSAVHCTTTTLLTGVMQSGHADVVRVLLENIAKLGRAAFVDQKPLALAAKVSVSRGMLSLLFMANPPRVMQRGHTEVVRVFLEHSANPDKPTSKVNTPLAWAAEVRA